jgi:hypothetical protein
VEHSQLLTQESVVGDQLRRACEQISRHSGHKGCARGYRPAYDEVLESLTTGWGDSLDQMAKTDRHRLHVLCFES